MDACALAGASAIASRGLWRFLDELLHFLIIRKKIALYIALAFDGLEDFKEENVYWAFC